MSLNINQDRDTKGQFAGGILLGDNAVMVRRDLATLPDFISKLGILCRGPFREVLTGRFHTGLANGKVELCLFSGDSPGCSCSDTGRGETCAFLPGGGGDASSN